MTTHSLLVKRLHSANPEVAITEEPKPEARIKQLFSSKTTLLQFLTNKDGKPMSDRQINALEQKYGKHPLSLWRDQSLLERQLEDAEGTIFDIIMPWVKEQENELNKDKTPEEQN